MMKRIVIFLIIALLLLSACSDVEIEHQQPDDSQISGGKIDFSQGVELSDDDFRLYNFDSIIEVENSNVMNLAFIRVEIGTNERFETFRGIGRNSSRDDVFSMYSGLDFSIRKQREFEGNRPSEIIVFTAEQGELVFMVTERDQEVRSIGIKSYVL